MAEDKKGDSQSVRLRAKTQETVAETMRQTGLSFPELIEFCVIIGCPVAKISRATARHILVEHGSL